MKYKIPKGNPKKIKWYDAKSYLRGISDLKDAKDTRNLIGVGESYGYIIAEDNYGVVVMTELMDLDKKDVDIDFTVIPKKWIIK